MADREELFTPDELAVRLDEWANCLDKSQWDLRSDLRCAAIHLRRLASSDGGVKGEPEPYAYEYGKSNGDGTYSVVIERPPLRAQVSDWPTKPLYTAPPADAGMREALAYAERLAVVLWSKHFKDSARNWKPLTGDLIGLLTQIDNMTAALTAPGATTKSDGGDLPANLAEIIETELTAWRGVNGGVFTIHAAALGISCAIRSAVFRANNTESDGGHGGQPYASTDAVEGASAPNATSGKQEGRTGIEVGASQTPGSSMSSGQSAPIVAGQAPGPSDPSSTRSGVTVEELADRIYETASAHLWKVVTHTIARALLDQFEIRRK